MEETKYTSIIRGIRQGDPLSPYLFIICAEGLSALMARYEQERWIQGVKVCKRAPSISHMLFADDSYLYCKAEEEQVGHILQLLQVFEGASGQKVNLEKSVVFFSSNTMVEKKVQLCELLNMEEANEDCTYLGLPNMMKRSKVATMGFLKDRIKKRAASWDGKLISQGGKEVLVKAVLQSLPTYAMSVFLVPLKIIRDIERTIARFWWSSKSDEHRGIHWMNWSRLSKHKAVGGMGFRDFRDFNLALLGKQGWRFLSKPNSLVSRVYKARYYPNNNFLEARLGDNPSFIWRSIMEAQNLVAAGTRWRVGSGVSIKILGQPWLVESENPYITSVSPSLNNNNVASLIDMNCREWDQEILRDLFNDRDQECIKKVSIGDKDSGDEVFWCKENHGHYSVRSAYRFLQVQKLNWREDDNNSFWRKIWRIRAPPKILNLVWRSLSYCLPTTVMLQQKGVSLHVVCPVCKSENETVEHVFLRCAQAVQCWQIVLPGIQNAGGSLWQWWKSILNNLDSDKRAEIAAICWSLWKARNEVVWKKKSTRIYVIIAQAKQYLEQWRYAQRSTTITQFPQLHEGDGVSAWVKPQVMHIKVSVDAATFRETKSSGIGMVARDDKGELVLAKTLYLNDVSNPEMAEGLAIKEALSWIKSQAWQNVTIESDCMVAVQAVRSKVHMISPFGRIIEDCRRRLQEQNTVSLFFIKRSANMAAHELARVSYSFPDRIFDRSFVPIGLENALKADLY